MWLFGYGSIIWKVDFPYTRKCDGYIKGYKRLFHQYSTDHRGTSEKPGRVVTLIPSNIEDVVWGVAYEIDDAEDGNVWKQLDFREKGGYTRQKCMFYPKDGSTKFQVVVYIGDKTNEYYAGEAPIEEIAKCIVTSKGKSGYNLDYLWQLVKAMRQIAPSHVDSHLEQLEQCTLKLVSKENHLEN